MMEYMVSDSRNLPPFTTDLTRNKQRRTNSSRTRKNDQMKDHVDPKGPKQRNHPKQLHTHYLPTDDVENISSTKKGRDLLLTNKPRIVP